MREIKFRAYDKRRNEFRYSAQYEKLSEFFMDVETNNLEVDRWTGLEDKNWIEIYERDIIIWINKWTPIETNNILLDDITTIRETLRGIVNYQIIWNIH